MITDMRWVKRTVGGGLKPDGYSRWPVRTDTFLQVYKATTGCMGADGNPQWGDFKWVDVRTEAEDAPVQD